MIKKKILGIYADKDVLHYVSVVKGISGYALKSPGQRHSLKHYDIKHGNGYALLRSLLTDLPVDSSRAIYLALPRSEVFIREITLPPMPVEDALLSIKNSLAIYSHLEPDAIYYDVIVSERNGEAFHALFVYAAKDEIEKYRKLFSETGHAVSLKGIFPLSYGVCALLDNNKNSYNAFFSLVQEDIIEIFASSGRTLIFSISCPVDAEDEKMMILNAAQNQFPEYQDMINVLNLDPPYIEDHAENQTVTLSKRLANQIITETGKIHTKKKSGKNKKLSCLPSFASNHASAAVAPFITGIQQISLDDQPVKIKIFHPFRYIIPFLLVLIVLLYFVMDHIDTQRIEAEFELNEITQQVTDLENNLGPLQNKIDTLKKASRFKTDVREFMRTRPALYTIINEIATLVPDGTWFANFTFNIGGITLRGTGTDALKTVELLRSSDLFNTVMLRGSVNRRPTGDENFTLSLELKPPKADDE
ncbi:MAG: PilN domain-containing protein, partial [Desulfamplus sp.]|nr:PilN domain-containing protein [Desulfamplus sp.]